MKKTESVLLNKSWRELVDEWPAGIRGEFLRRAKQHGCLISKYIEQKCLENVTPISKPKPIKYRNKDAWVVGKVHIDFAKADESTQAECNDYLFANAAHPGYNLLTPDEIAVLGTIMVLNVPFCDLNDSHQKLLTTLRNFVRELRRLRRA